MCVDLSGLWSFDDGLSRELQGECLIMQTDCNLSILCRNGTQATGRVVDSSVGISISPGPIENCEGYIDQGKVQWGSCQAGEPSASFGGFRLCVK